MWCYTPHTLHTLLNVAERCSVTLTCPPSPLTAGLSDHWSAQADSRKHRAWTPLEGGAKFADVMAGDSDHNSRSLQVIICDEHEDFTTGAHLQWLHMLHGRCKAIKPQLENGLVEACVAGINRSDRPVIHTHSPAGLFRKVSSMCALQRSYVATEVYLGMDWNPAIAIAMWIVISWSANCWKLLEGVRQCYRTAQQLCDNSRYRDRSENSYRIRIQPGVRIALVVLKLCVKTLCSHCWRRLCWE